MTNNGTSPLWNGVLQAVRLLAWFFVAALTGAIGYGKMCHNIDTIEDRVEKNARRVDKIESDIIVLAREQAAFREQIGKDVAETKAYVKMLLSKHAEP